MKYSWWQMILLSAIPCEWIITRSVRRVGGYHIADDMGGNRYHLAITVLEGEGDYRALYLGERRG